MEHILLHWASVDPKIRIEIALFKDFIVLKEWD